MASNLISNAVKYSPLGAEVNVILEFQNGQYLFTVRDHGIGIEPEDQEHLFTAFHRGSNVGRVTGTGLGLAIVKQAVTLHNGAIDLESVVGKGTTVSVSLPAQPVDPNVMLN